MYAPDFRGRLTRTRDTWLRDIIKNGMKGVSSKSFLMRRVSTVSKLAEKMKSGLSKSDGGNPRDSKLRESTSLDSKDLPSVKRRELTSSTGSKSGTSTPKTPRSLSRKNSQEEINVLSNQGSVN